MSERRDKPGADAGRRPGRHTTFSVEAYRGEAPEPIEPEDLLDSEATGRARVDAAIDGYHQPTAMFDKGQFLGELAEVVDAVPDTRAAIEAEAAAPKGCRLIIVAGPDLGMEWAFKTPEIVLGRDEECDLMMSDIAVSRRHAKIALEDGQFFLYDLGSGNGTFLNGTHIDREELSPGDELTVGERTLRFVELNEAPPTAAAHPVPKELPQEPSVGDVPPDDDEGFAPVGRASQIDVGVVPDPASAVPSTKHRAPVSARRPPHPEPGSALKRLATVLGILALVAAVSVGGWVVYDRHVRGEAEAAALARAKVEFMQGVALVKSKRCGDANVLFARVLAVRPDYAPAARYRAHCVGEIAEWQKLEAARSQAASGREDAAIRILEGVGENSAYAEDAKALTERFHRQAAIRSVKRAQELLGAQDLDGAEQEIERALARAPGLSSALAVREEIATLRAATGRRRRPRPASRFPPILERAVLLYRQGNVGAAIDAAEAAGGVKSVELVRDAKRVKKLLREARAAHEAKAAAELLRLIPLALELDKQIAPRRGKVREELNAYYADGLYLKGIEADQSGDHGRAYQLLNQARHVRPGHTLAESRLAELRAKAAEIYYEGYVLKDSNAAETRRIFKRVTEMTAPDDNYHRLARQWLARNPG